MGKSLDRRSVIAGSVSAAVVAIAGQSDANASPFDSERIASALTGLEGFEITGSSFEPHYRAGSMIFIRPGCASKSDHVCVIRKTAPPIIAQLIHHDDKALYVCGFASDQRMQVIPKAAISRWGCIVVAFKL